MVDHMAVTATGSDCERYWRAAGISRREAAEMRRELESHLIDASRDGRTIESVVGDDVGAFAAEWAAAQRPADDGELPTWTEVFKARRKRSGLATTAVVAAGVAVIVIAALLAGDGSEAGMDNEMWRWIWVGAAGFLAVAEVITAGFFMLPFAVGATAAAALAWAGVAPVVQLVVFIILSLLSLWGMQRWVKKEDENQPRMGSNRLLDARATVLEPIDRVTGSGRVRMETEHWRATTDGGPIPEGAEVRVVEVRGARLVVEPVDTP